MKSRALSTVHDLIVTDYTITRQPNGRFLHAFRPATTETVYQFEANSTPILQEGKRYNVGFIINDNGTRIIEPSALALVDEVNPTLSYLAAKKFSSDIFTENKAKNDERVTHTAADYYWGKKYAWRAYGLVVAKEAFYQYLEEIRHPAIPCKTSNPDLPYAGNEDSVAYRDFGLEQAMDQLISTTEKVGRYFKSPLFSRKFQIRAINAITDKK